MFDTIFEDLHAKRVESIANGAVGAMHACRAGIAAIGAAYAEVADIKPKHGIKQVDRYLSNAGIDLDEMLPMWAKFVIGPRNEIVLALDWTEFDPDDHMTLCAYVITNHGRATPLCWRTYKKSRISEGARTDAEFAIIDRLAGAIPPNVAITLLADRAFGNQVLYRTLAALGWDYVIRFRGCIVVEHEGKAQPAEEWLPASGRATKLADVRVTNDRTLIPAVVAVHDKKMSEAWFLATSHGSKRATEIVKLYGRRFTIEETFRDQKDLRFGMGLYETHVRSEARRDRLLMLLALAQALLTLLGAASERCGMDMYLKANTVKTRTHSLLRQGSYWYRCIPTMRDEWLNNLMSAYVAVLAEHAEVTQMLGVI